MKKQWICIPLLAAFLLTGCGQTAQSDKTGSASDTEQPVSIDQIAAEFFASDYEYTKTTVQYTESDGEEAGQKTVLEGAVIQSPYQESVRVVESTTPDTWTEAYYSGDGETVDAMLLTNGGWTRTQVRRERPYGCDQKLTFAETGKQKQSGRSVTVYTTDYTVDIDTHTGDDPILSAVISQTYYVDAQTQKLICIVTDLTDLDRKTQMMNDITANGVTAEQAEKNLADTEIPRRIETLDIHAYGEAVNIASPAEEAGSGTFTKIPAE